MLFSLIDLAGISWNYIASLVHHKAGSLYAQSDMLDYLSKVVFSPAFMHCRHKEWSIKINDEIKLKWCLEVV